MGYYVTRNAQGDICAIYNRADNSLVGTYQYDTWGNILSITPASSTSDPNGILQKNPFRYRGYYYDNESGYYYLQSRYYNPQVRRFLNADNLVAETKNGLGYNLFAYSNNNPVNYKDESGHTPDTVFDIIFICVDIAEVAANPANPVAWISLGADVACLIIPVVSGGGAAVKVASKLDDGADALKAGIVTAKPNQVHHYATNKSKTYTHAFKNITDKYGLNLNDAWNKESLAHQGRHPNAYHDFVLDTMRNIDNIANGNIEIFLDLYEVRLKVLFKIILICYIQIIGKE